MRLEAVVLSFLDLLNSHFSSPISNRLTAKKMPATVRRLSKILVWIIKARDIMAKGSMLVVSVTVAVESMSMELSMASAFFPGLG